MSQQTLLSRMPFALTAFTTVLSAAVPAVYSTAVDASNNQITITGDNFSPSGLAPKVVFAHTALALVSFTNRSVVAQLPLGFAAGSYSLTITNSISQSGAISVTLGAVGP